MASFLCKPAPQPNTVLFGGSLPRAFFECAEADAPKADLLLVAGTSLLVSPANSLVRRVGAKTTRLVVNREPVGEDLGIRFSA
jgi:NAD-dependent SIR2 family protein deacetylase